MQSVCTSLFADMDSFAGLGFSGGKRPDKMSLAEQLKKSEKVKAEAREKQASDWDSLFGGSSSSPAAPQWPSAASASPVGNGTQLQTQSRAQSASLIDEFDIFVTAKPATASAGSPAPAAASAQDEDPLAIFATAPKPQTPELRQPRPQSTQRSPPPRESARPERPTGHPARRSASELDDAKIAQLVDMGFDADHAKKALTAMNGDVRGAVSYIMADAQGMPLPEPRRQTQDYDVSALATEFGTTVLAKASSMWSFGKKSIAKAVSEYQGGGGSGGSSSRSAGDSSTPAWMRDAEKYRQRETASATPPLQPPKPQSRPAARQFTSDDSMPSRPSRAQAFRDKRAAMSDPSSPSPSTPTASSRSSSAAASTAAPAAAPAAAQAPVVDLLNLDAPQSTPASTIDMWSAPASSTVSVSSASGQDHRGNGLEAYKRGDYALAIEHFDAALAALEATHILRALILSNRAACNLKSGNFRGAIDDTQQGLRVLPAGRLDGLEIERGKPAREIWSKLVLRQAEALEHAERYREAGLAYQQLLDNGFASPTVLAARRRCQKALDPQIEAKAAAPVEKKSQRRKWNTGGEPTSAAGKAALQKVRDEHKRQATLEAERDGLRDIVSQRIDAWKTGKEDNLRALLASLHTVLWPDSGWQPVGLHDLVLTKKVRLTYMKAVAKTHPDKVPASASTEVKMIAQGVFVAINKAWDTFRTENGL